MATITITTTPAQDARIAAAFGDRLMLGGNANAAQVRQFLIDQLIKVVLEYERNQVVVDPVDVP